MAGHSDEVFFRKLPGNLPLAGTFKIVPTFKKDPNMSAGHPEEVSNPLCAGARKCTHEVADPFRDCNNDREQTGTKCSGRHSRFRGSKADST